MRIRERSCSDGRSWNAVLTDAGLERLRQAWPTHPDYLSTIVLVSPAGDLHGLTPRELQVLGLLVEGWPNRRIAVALVVSDHTIITHVEHILAKLAVPTRAAAAALALRLGLYVPRLPTRVGS